MTLPTPVTTIAMVRLNKSSRSPITASNASEFLESSILSQVRYTRGKVSAPALRRITKSIAVMKKATTAAPTEIYELNSGLRRVKRVMTAAANNGRNRIIQPKPSQFSNMLVFHPHEIFHVRGLAPAIQRDDQRQAHRDLRRRHSDDEEHEHLAVEIAVEAGHRHEREIGRVQHHFEAHVDHEQVAAHDDA